MSASPSLLRASVLIAGLAFASPSRADDWPTFRGNLFRNGATTESLDPLTLRQAWVHAAPQPPRPAWPGPARWDAYNAIKDLRSMRNYDPVFHPIAFGDAVYFGSSVDDTLYCLDASTGKIRWRFATQGPIRIAPTYEDGRLHFGSDDGHAYCVSAADGALVWKHRPSADTSLVLHQGRLISFWPVRTGVIVIDDTAYYAASLFPWKPSYFCAVDARTGEPKGPNRYVRELTGMTLEGAMLASAKKLIVPQGRVAPLSFDRADGKPQGLLEGTGGCFALLTEDDNVILGPGNKKGTITTSTMLKKAKAVSFQRGNSVAVRGDTAWLLDDHSLLAFNRKTQVNRWWATHPHACELVVAGDTVFVGARDEVAAYRASDGARLWKHAVHGRAHGLAVADGKLIVSTDEGRVYAFVADKKKEPAPVVAVETEPGPPLFAIPKVDDAGLLGRWVFQTPAVKVGPSNEPRAFGTVDDLAGGSPGKLLAPPILQRVGSVMALALDGEHPGVELQKDYKKAKLPVQDLTLSAWVRLDAVKEWGGIVCCFQDNGPYERGWILGIKGDRFCLGVAAVDGRNVMTYLSAKQPYQLGKWHHVAGAYDGAQMRLFMDGKVVAESDTQKGKIRYSEKGAVYHLGAYRDDDENFPLKGMLHEVRVYDRALTSDVLKEHFDERKERFPPPVVFAAKPTFAPLPLAEGPMLRFTAPDKAVLQWKATQPGAATVEFGEGDATSMLSAGSGVKHQVNLAELRRERIYRYRIRETRSNKEFASEWFECDTAQNFTTSNVVGKFAVEASKQTKALAESLLKRTKETSGVAVVVNDADGTLAYEMIQRSRFNVVLIEPDAKRADTLRQRFLDAGIHGSRVSVLHAEPSRAKLPACFANLVVVHRPQPNTLFAVGAPVAQRWLKPGHGTIVTASFTDDKTETANAWINGLDPEFMERVKSAPEAWGSLATFVRMPLKGVGEWTHMFGSPDNSAFGGETLGGVNKTSDLEVQWFGQPGPRFNVDRNPRKPAPLAVNGRLFVQGFGRLLGMDAYNGTILWSLELPKLRRYNILRDSSNWCADADRVYLAIDSQCWVLEAATGVVQKKLDLPKDSAKSDWSYLARSKGHLIGTTVAKGSGYTEYWGNVSWYDEKTGPNNCPVCSDTLFVQNATDGAPQWNYAGGAIINPTITVADGKVFFVESRNPALAKNPTGRIGADLWKDLHLVALDLATGSRVYSKPIEPLKGVAAFSMAHSDGKLVVVSSEQQRFGVTAFDAKDGSQVWDKKLKWEADHHGKHLSRPAITGGKLVVRPYVMKLATGEMLQEKFPTGHTCASYCATSETLIFRAGELTMWNLDKNTDSRWPRMRSDCLLSTIVAGGMVLSPEGGGGCSCGNWLEMSAGFLPKSLR